MTEDPAISVVMLSRNNPEIALSANAIANQLNPEDEFIMVDDHSAAEYRKRIGILSDKLGITLIDSDVRGNRSHNRNLGASNATRDVIVFVDGDMVVLDGGIASLRSAFRTRPESAYVGHVHGMTFDSEAIALYSGMDDYVAKARTIDGRMEIRDNPLFAEKRLVAHDAALRYRDYYWLDFYSAVCAVDRNAFDTVGRFDESYTSWGCEDVDLGYRISKSGRAIGFADDLHSIHIPHPRNVVKTEKSNREGMMYAVEKYQCWEWEVVATFRNTTTAVISVDQVIRRMRLVSFPNMDKVPEKSSVIIEAISQTNPRGRVLVCDRTGRSCEYSQIGLSLPQLRDSQVRVCYVSSNVFAYPPVIAAEILREATRVAERVCIVDSGDRTRIDWQPIIGDFSCEYRGRDDHFCHDIMEFSFERRDGVTRVARHES